MKLKGSAEFLQWKEKGQYLTYKSGHQIFAITFGSIDASSEKTLLLFHGFPESSYSYHSIIEGMLEKFNRIILFDFLGFGWSNKPENYSKNPIMDHADLALFVWNHFKIKGGHLIAHDMGNSVATEILARREEGSLPNWLSDGIKSMTFTNGSIVLKLAELRITQKILISRFGPLMKYFLSYKLFKHQIKSAQGNDQLSSEEIQNLWFSNLYLSGHKKSHLTIRYITDRIEFEEKRWIPSLAKTDLPIHLCWGDQDQVAKVEMAHYLKNKVCRKAKLTIMEGLGHFCQLGNPHKWMLNIKKFYTESLDL
jgi:pimeloyl-ACP methyl ester carboxylesterase